MATRFLLLGMVLTVYDVARWSGSSLTRNITKRIILVVSGLYTVWRLFPSFLSLHNPAPAVGLLIGCAFLAFHVWQAGGIRLRASDIGPGMVMTMALIYLLELPAEELLYRGLVFVSAWQVWGLAPAVAFSSVLFYGLHLRTWRNPSVQLKAAVLGAICAIAAAMTGSLWTALIIHALNDLGFLTLVGRRNIFPDTAPDAMLRS